MLQLTQRVQEEAGVREVDVGEYLINAGVAESESNTGKDWWMLNQFINQLRASSGQQYGMKELYDWKEIDGMIYTYIHYWVYNNLYITISMFNQSEEVKC